jgi:hypothetical protein
MPANLSGKSKLPISATCDECADAFFGDDAHILDVSVFVDLRQPFELFAVFKFGAFPAAFVASLHAAVPNLAVCRATFASASSAAPHFHHRPQTFIALRIILVLREWNFASKHIEPAFAQFLSQIPCKVGDDPFITRTIPAIQPTIGHEILVYSFGLFGFLDFRFW